MKLPFHEHLPNVKKLPNIVHLHDTQTFYYPLIGGKCLIFDACGPDEEHSEFGLLLVIEIHGSEMDYARKNGGRKLIEKLKESGVYP